MWQPGPRSQSITSAQGWVTRQVILPVRGEFILLRKIYKNSDSLARTDTYHGSGQDSKYEMDILNTQKVDQHPCTA
jgi:hypothetical protein